MASYTSYMARMSMGRSRMYSMGRFHDLLTGLHQRHGEPARDFYIRVETAMAVLLRQGTPTEVTHYMTASPIFRQGYDDAMRSFTRSVFLAGLNEDLAAAMETAMTNMHPSIADWTQLAMHVDDVGRWTAANQQHYGSAAAHEHGINLHLSLIRQPLVPLNTESAANVTASPEDGTNRANPN